jgi:ubiquinone/menaquinone biosynthesis C-methylase UbiE
MSLYKKFHAWALDKFNQKYERLIGERKRALLGGLSGTIVEIGPGTGPNLKYYNKNITWIGIEPNEYAHAYVEAEAERQGINNYRILKLTAQSLPLASDSIDVVVSTLVLCTVPNQPVALSEIRRILKPGGKFVFIEHVAAVRGTFMRRFQRLIRPAWRVIADGCHTDRETFTAIANAGFGDVQGDCFYVYNTFVSPHVAGVARK